MLTKMVNGLEVICTEEEEAEILAEWARNAPKPPTIQQQKEAISAAIQKLLDDKAKSLRYDSILSARSYAGYANPFQAEAIKLANWSADCWATAGNIEAQVNSGVIPIPTVAEALAMMPPYVV